jgi:D-sedoheptulose 7-phosphate isomerase
LVGKGGGGLAGLVDVAIVVPSDSTPRVQECHISVIHALCELVDAALFPETLEA